MLLVCRLDYSILDRFGTLAAGIVVALMLLATQFGLTVKWSNLPPVSGWYADSNHGIAVVVCSIVRGCTLSLPWTGIWMYLETAVVGIASCVCGTYLCKICFTMLMCLGMLVLTIVAVSRDWYQVNKKRTLTGLAICIGALPLVLIMILARTATCSLSAGKNGRIFNGITDQLYYVAGV